MGIPFGLRTRNVVMSGMFLVRQVISNNSPSRVVASRNCGSVKAVVDQNSNQYSYIINILIYSSDFDAINTFHMYACSINKTSLIMLLYLEMLILHQEFGH